MHLTVKQARQNTVPTQGVKKKKQAVKTIYACKKLAVVNLLRHAIKRKDLKI